MEGIQGGVLGVKLRHLDKWTQERRRVAHRYHELLGQHAIANTDRSEGRRKRLPPLRRPSSTS